MKLKIPFRELNSYLYFQASTEANIKGKIKYKNLSIHWFAQSFSCKEYPHNVLHYILAN
jgi:hypothetical protein